MQKAKLHPTGLSPESLAALVLDFMWEQKLGLRGLAAAADLVAAECRFNVWILNEVKGSALIEEGWIKLLEDGEAMIDLAKSAMRSFAENRDCDALCATFAIVTEHFNDHSLLRE